MIVPDIILKMAKSAKDFSDASEIILEYVNWLGIDLHFQDFYTEIENLENMYSAPSGGLILAVINDVTVGVAGLRRLEDNVCELKRMFVKEEYRKQGVGRLLLEYAIELAKKLNYHKMKLDTLDSMKPAINLYKEYGFVEIPPYRYNPEESARYFKLEWGDIMLENKFK